MNEIVSVTVAHRHGRVEAVRRLREGLDRTQGQLGPMVTMEQVTWQGDTLLFRMRALGQTAAGRIEVLDDALRIEVTLPWLLAKAADRLLSFLRKETTKLLERS
ncbi:MAG: polyhydroxyalkanoic acid system family protein [Rubrivivax sp.]